MHIPPRFLRLVLHREDSRRGLSGLCAGYERGRWRAEEFAQHVIDWIPDFALSQAELDNVHGGNLMLLARKATRAIYETEKYQLRGEFGEIILHALIRDIFGSTAAVKKIYFKDGANEVVKGFDAVHVVSSGDRFELWLGESKFYDDAADAIRDVVAELEKHLKVRYLRTEFAAITNKLNPSWEHYNRVERLLHENTSLDEVFDCLRIPVLLTYDSQIVGEYARVCEEYDSAFRVEVERHMANLNAKVTKLESVQGFEVNVHLFLIPLKAKRDLLDALHKQLRATQGR